MHLQLFQFFGHLWTVIALVGLVRSDVESIHYLGGDGFGSKQCTHRDLAVIKMVLYVKMSLLVQIAIHSPAIKVL